MLQLSPSRERGNNIPKIREIARYKRALYTISMQKQVRATRTQKNKPSLREPRTRGARFRRKHPLAYYLLGGLGIVLFWRGVWGLLDHYLFPEYQVLSFVISAVAGLVVLYMDDFSLDELRAR